MSPHDRDFLTACLVVILAIFVFGACLMMPMRGDLIESPAIFPGFMSVVLFTFGVAYALRSLSRGGRIKPGQLFRSVVLVFTSGQNRLTLLGIFFPAVYVFVAIPLIGFYISSALFMTLMFYAYVKRWRRWLFLPVSVGVTVGLYLIFNRLFMLQIW